MRARPPDSLHARLLLAALLPLLLLAVAGVAALQSAFASAVERGFDQRLRESLDALIASVEPDAGGVLVARRTLSESGFARVRSGWYWQVAGRDGALKRSRSLWDAELDIGATTVGDGPSYGNAVGPAGEHLRIVARRVSWPAQGEALTYALAGPRADIDAEIARFRWLSIAGIAGLLLASAIALLVQVRLGLRPLRQLGVQLAEIERGRRERLSAPGASELAALADKINDVLDHNQRMAERGRKLAGDLAHALKTPLAVLRSEVDRAQSPAVEQSLARLDELIQRHLARASAQARREHARTELAPLLQSLREMFLKLHGARDIDLRLDLAPGLVIACESDDLGEMLGNLIDNACRAAAGVVRVSARSVGLEVEIRVDDDGSGLDEARLALLGTRGQRFDEQPGSGLGLSITRDIATSHRGDVAFARSELGGLSACLRLPQAPA